MKCMIIEDEIPAVKILQNHISHFPDLEIIHIFHNAVEGMVQLQRSPVDVLFLDIQLPKMSGIELLHTLEARPAIILTTAFREYALEGYELEITDYLLKPISFERFVRAVRKLYGSRKHPFQPPLNVPIETEYAEPFIYIKHDREFIKVNLKEILYVESVKNHIKLVTPSKALFTLIGIGEMEQKLPSHFIRTHRSYIVNTRQIERFSQTNVTIGGKIFPLGNLYKQAFFQWVNKNTV
ncbi:DNA-binding LytR/AlgR family response regulator [Algoriphagus sp. 4150]|uniref:LytR/AlgR family response regulator transcription factor n=1 Tax=Algoriphagus sp. 4150 TaxID=2817756 RepID=UPI002867578D|nr:LytTR family DNA-binding domain-containing protein [Algoriphagus sp. 4150]MDR7131473.1 DNA-binding LytR/AlgR family response regulator [Algoriphagus sp. 4150]